jgi:hypothetical protein
MADGGRWVWQPDPPRDQGRPQWAQAPRGRGAGQGQMQNRQGRPQPPQIPQGQQVRPPIQQRQPPLLQDRQEQVEQNQTQNLRQGRGANQVKVTSDPQAAVQNAIDPRYRHMSCYNSGEPGHFVGICVKPKVCFIYAIPGHYMTSCPVWKRNQLIAACMGSAGKGLGFYHIDLPDLETTRWLNLSNCGVVVVKRGQITLNELEGELSAIFCKDWPWQIRELTPIKFLVRFPPHRKVADFKTLPSFNLRKEGVQVEVVEWVGDLEHFSELTEVWIQMEGIPPK